MSYRMMVLVLLAMLAVPWPAGAAEVASGTWEDPTGDVCTTTADGSVRCEQPSGKNYDHLDWTSTSIIWDESSMRARFDTVAAPFSQPTEDMTDYGFHGSNSDSGTNDATMSLGILVYRAVEEGHIGSYITLRDHRSGQDTDLELCGATVSWDTSGFEWQIPTSCLPDTVDDWFFSLQGSDTTSSGVEYVDYAPGGSRQGPTWLHVTRRPPPTARDITDTCDQHAGAASFEDVDGNVHRYAIDCVVGYGITKGRSQDSYEPEGLLTAGQTASFLHRTLTAAGVNVPAGGERCGGTAGVHEEAVEALIDAGIVPPEACDANLPVERAEMARWVADALAYAGVASSEATDWFYDDDGHEQESAINAVTSHGVVTGVAPARFSPEAQLRRDQMATFLARTLDTILDR